MSEVNARDDILSRVRDALGRSDANRAQAEAEVLAAIEAPRRGPRTVPQGGLAERFSAEARVMSSTLDEVVSLADVPAAVRRYLDASGLSREVVVWPQFGELDWAAAGLDGVVRAVSGADLVGITGCFCAIAETGTLMTCSSPDMPAATSLLPETHIAVVPVSRIVAGMEEAWALARRELGMLPRAVNFISGPSRTGDIELTIVLGAHGPYRVHLILLRDH